MNKLITINPNRIDLDEAYMQMAEVWAKRSKANRKQVGALIVKDKQIISDGYNGMPAGDEDDTCETWAVRTDDPTLTPVLRTKSEVLHAESNALAKIAENGGVGAQGATLYVTMSPCKECAKLIKQAKIKRVVFRELYRDREGIDFLLKRGVAVDQLVQAEVDGASPNSTRVPERSVAPPVQPEPKSPLLDQSSRAEVSRLRTLAAVAGKPAPAQGSTLVEPTAVPVVQGPTLVQQPVVPPVQGPMVNEPLLVNDVAAALAAAGISLEDGVPVERPSTPEKKPQVDDGGYVSSFF